MLQGSQRRHCRLLSKAFCEPFLPRKDGIFVTLEVDAAKAHPEVFGVTQPPRYGEGASPGEAALVKREPKAALPAWAMQTPPPFRETV